MILKKGLVFSIVLLCLACSNKETKTNNEDSDFVAKESPVFNEKGLKIGFYYADSLNANYQFILATTKKIEAKINSMSASFQSKMTNFQNWANDKAEKAQKGLLLSSEIQAFQQESQERQYNLQMEQQQLQMQIQQIQSENLMVAINRVEDFTHRYAKEHGYDLILQYSKGGQVVFVNPDMDITKAIVNGLNEEYEATQNELEK